MIEPNSSDNAKEDEEAWREWELSEALKAIDELKDSNENSERQWRMFQFMNLIIWLVILLG